jgi:hypothetical protein
LPPNFFVFPIEVGIKAHGCFNRKHMVNQVWALNKFVYYAESLIARESRYFWHDEPLLRWIAEAEYFISALIVPDRRL